MIVKRLEVLNGGYEKSFQVGEKGVYKITKNDKDEGAYIVFLRNNLHKEIDVKAQNILVYWDWQM